MVKINGLTATTEFIICGHKHVFAAGFGRSNRNTLMDPHFSQEFVDYFLSYGLGFWVLAYGALVSEFGVYGLGLRVVMFRDKMKIGAKQMIFDLTS